MSKAFDKLKAAVTQMKSGATKSTYVDPNEGNWWKLEGDKAGNGSAVLRFLPAKDDDSLPYEKVYNHGFQNSSARWFIEECPTTIGKPCPVCDDNSTIVAGNWKGASKEVKEIVRIRKRKMSYIVNVLVIQDRANPDNEGKVFLWKFGKSIFDKIMECIDPPKDENGNLLDEDAVAFNPFDLAEGADFKLMMRRVDGYANFEKSEFKKQTEVDNGADLVKQLHDLSQFVDPNNFKSYEAIKEKYEKVWYGTGTATRKEQTSVDDDDDTKDDASFAKAAATKTVEKKAPPPAPKKAVEEDDDDLDYFRKLAEEDD